LGDSNHRVQNKDGQDLEGLLVTLDQ
jgi:hypothetical protein